MVAGIKPLLLKSSNSSRIPIVGSLYFLSDIINMISLVKKKAGRLILPVTERNASQATIPDLPQARQQHALPPAREQQNDHLPFTDLAVPPPSAAWQSLKTCINIEKATSDLTFKKEKKKMKTLHPVKELLECEYCDMKFSVNTML